jgi:hypothetical protein
MMRRITASSVEARRTITRTPGSEHPGRYGVALGKGLGTHQTTDDALAADET